MSEDFVCLHQHTVESHKDAIIDIDQLFDRVKELGQKAVAVTDHGTMGGIYKAWQASKRTGVKLIPGNEVYFVTNINAENKTHEGWKRYHLVLLAYNEKGYRNLLRINYEGFKNRIYVKPPLNKVFPRIDLSILEKYSEGLFALSACGGNIIAQHLIKNDFDNAKRYASEFKRIFGNRFYIELQPHDLEARGFSQIELNDRMKQVAEELEIPMVATCDAHYLKKEHEPYHDMILAIADKKSQYDLSRHRYHSEVLCNNCNGKGFLGEEKTKNSECAVCGGIGIVDFKLCQEFYVKSQKEVLDFFSPRYGESFSQTLIRNTSLIADQCDIPTYIEPDGTEHIPNFNMHHISQSPDVNDFIVWRDARKLDNEKDDVAYMKFLSWKGFVSYSDKMKFDYDTKKKYWDRMSYEIDVYATRGFASYMCIVADYIRWAKNNGILVGPGRGSVGGSLAAFFMGIHMIDSIKYGLLFERFVNLQKKSLPDVDSDFAPSGRHLVYEYVQNKYGHECVAYISNLNRFTPKVLIKDLTKSFRVGGDVSEAFRLANIATDDIPNKVTLKNGKTIEIDSIKLALEHATGDNLRSLLQREPKIEEYAEFLVGLPRDYATHAAGVIISDIPLPDFAPVRRDQNGNYAVQWDKRVAEDNGLVKMDFLGLETLDIIDETFSQSRSLGIDLLTIEELVDNTEKEGAYKVINSGLTIGCFQIEGATLQPLCKPMRTKTIEDIAAINALGRPSCSKLEREQFINRRHGKEEVEYPHWLLKDILNHTYGISMYEEDLLKLAQFCAGWDLSEADGLRKLTKLKEKGGDLADKLKVKFVNDVVKKHSVSVKEAEHIWDKVVVPFSGYGFNKSHAIGYSLIGYMTAYYKYYARGPFFAAVLNSKLRKKSKKKDEHTDVMSKIKADAKMFKVNIAACDINKSGEYYVATSKTNIVTGLGAVGGLGEKGLADVKENQPYSSFYDFVLRGTSKCNKTAVTALAKAGAFDSLGVSRKFASEHFSLIKEEMKKYLNKLFKSSGGSMYFENEDRKKPMIDAIENFKYSGAEFFDKEWPLKELLEAERTVLGEYISGSVKDIYPGFFTGGVYDITIDKLKLMSKQDPCSLEGIVVGIKELQIKRGKQSGRTMAKVVIESVRNEQFETTVFSDKYEKYKSKLSKGIPIKGNFSVDEWNGSKSLVLESCEVYKVKK